MMPRTLIPVLALVVSVGCQSIRHAEETSSQGVPGNGPGIAAGGENKPPKAAEKERLITVTSRPLYGWRSSSIERMEGGNVTKTKSVTERMLCFSAGGRSGSVFWSKPGCPPPVELNPREVYIFEIGWRTRMPPWEVGGPDWIPDPRSADPQAYMETVYYIRRLWLKDRLLLENWDPGNVRATPPDADRTPGR